MGKDRRRSLRIVFEFLGLSKSSRFRRRRMRVAILAVILVLSTFTTIIFPVRTVKGLVTSTTISPSSGAISIDSNRVVGLLSSSGPVFVYDIASGTSATFPVLQPTGFNFIPAVYGNKIIEPGGPASITAPMNIYYCVLPAVAVATACPAAGAGSWTLLVGGIPSLASLAASGAPLLNRDLVVWPITNGFSYFRFSSGATTTVATGTQATAVSTNGAIIAYVLGGILWYTDTTSCVAPCTPALVSTGLPASATSISQSIIAFTEPGPPTRIRYYDVNTGVASAAGAGPIGSLTGPFSGPSIWASRIVFSVSETDIGFDCGGVAGIQSNELCMRYWNIGGPGWITPLLVPEAAPPVSNGGIVIYDKTVAFLSPSGVLQYATVPMQGDINQDGKVDVLDAAVFSICFDQVLKGTGC